MGIMSWDLDGGFGASLPLRTPRLTMHCEYRVVLCSLTLCLVGCASQTRGSAETDPILDDQLGIFAAVVQGVMDEADFAGWVVMVDPRPINVYHDPIFPDVTHFLSVEPSVISARASVVRDLGAVTASALPKRPKCTPFLILPRDRVTSGCPSQNEVVWVLAAEAEAEKDEWILRMIGIFYSPRSSSARTYDAIVTRSEDGWVLDRLITHVIWE